MNNKQCYGKIELEAVVDFVVFFNVVHVHALECMLECVGANSNQTVSVKRSPQTIIIHILFIVRCPHCDWYGFKSSGFKEKNHVDVLPDWVSLFFA